MNKIAGSFLLAGLFSGGPALVLPQQPDIDRELEEAKALYREAKFAQAVAKLQGTIVRLEQLRDLEGRRIQLSDAHLHLALSYVALNDPSAAKESLKQMLRADRNRRLDPDVYAPKVIELFEEARAEVAREPATAVAAPTTASSPQAAVAKKGGSKGPLIALGVGAAAAGGIAVAKGGAGSTGSTPTASATPTPTPVVSGPQDIVLVGTTPPPGSTISLSSGAYPLTGMLSVVHNETGDDYCLQLLTQSPGHGRDTNDACLVQNGAPSFQLTAGQARTTSVPIALNGRTTCPVPFTVSALNSCLIKRDPPARADCYGTNLFCRQFVASYTFVR